MKLTSNLLLFSLFSAPLLGVYSFINPFYFLILFLVFYLIIDFRKKKFINIKINLGNMSPTFIFLIIYVFIYLYKMIYGYYEKNINEVYNMVIWVPFSFFIAQKLNNHKNYFSFFNKLLPYLLFATIILSLYKFNSLANGVINDLWYYDKDIIILGTSLNGDYNVFSLYFIILYFLVLKRVDRISTSTFQKQIITILLIIISLIIIVFTGSRRGTVLFIVVSFLIFNPFKSILYISVFIFLLIYYIENFILYLNLDSINLIDRVLSIGNIQSADERFIRWKWSLNEIYNYSIFEIFFGKGHYYLKDLANFTRASQLDYPHNIFISSFHIGGLVSIISLFVITIKSSIFWIQNRKNYEFLTIIYFTELFLSLSSNNTIFDSRLLWILSIVPIIFKIYDKN